MGGGRTTALAAERTRLAVAEGQRSRLPISLPPVRQSRKREDESRVVLEGGGAGGAGWASLLGVFCSFGRRVKISPRVQRLPPPRFLFLARRRARVGSSDPPPPPPERGGSPPPLFPMAKLRRCSTS